jgi:hypothetical protein
MKRGFDTGPVTRNRRSTCAPGATPSSLAMRGTFSCAGALIASPWRPQTSWPLAEGNEYPVACSFAMTLDVYADLFEDDLDQVADRLDRAATRAGADSVRTDQAGPALDAVRPSRRHRG